jgi:xanthine dehydrogenase accessory factor
MTGFGDHQVVVRGGGDLATGVVARLHRAGFPVIVLELPEPLAIRRTVSVAEAVRQRTVEVEDLTARLVQTAEEAVETATRGTIPVLVSVGLPVFPAPTAAIVDARLAKTGQDTTIEQAPLVVGLGPGFVAGVDCHAVVETLRGHHLGRVRWSGPAAADTGLPGSLGGHAARRVIRAARSGTITWEAAIGDFTESGRTMGTIEGDPVRATIDGVIRGLIAPSVRAHPGLKIADIDPRADRATCFEISDKALAVGGGVLEAVLSRLSEERPG